MGLGNTFCQLGHLLEEWDRDGTTIDAVTVEDGPNEDGMNRVDVTLSVPLDSGESNSNSCQPRVTDDGSLSIDIDTGITIGETGGDVVDVTPTDATVTTGGLLNVTLSTRFETDESARFTPEPSSQPSKTVDDSNDSESSQTEQTRRRDVPPFEDPDLLREIYESHDTFAEMADALEMDVTGETVRRYMIDWEIHEPNTYRTNESRDSSHDSAQNSADDSDDTEDATDRTNGHATDRTNGHATDASDDLETIVLSDGIGLPENVDAEDLIDAVNEANTIYEVKEALDMSRSEAHTMLKELNMIDLVLGRLSDDSGRVITREDVIQRLRTVAQQQAQPAV